MFYTGQKVVVLVDGYPVKKGMVARVRERWSFTNNKWVITHLCGKHGVICHGDEIKPFVSPKDVAKAKAEPPKLRQGQVCRIIRDESHHTIVIGTRVEIVEVENQPSSSGLLYYRVVPLEGGFRYQRWASNRELEPILAGRS